MKFSCVVVFSIISLGSANGKEGVSSGRPYQLHIFHKEELVSEPVMEVMEKLLLTKVPVYKTTITANYSRNRDGQFAVRSVLADSHSKYLTHPGVDPAFSVRTAQPAVKPTVTPTLKRETQEISIGGVSYFVSPPVADTIAKFPAAQRLLVLQVLLTASGNNSGNKMNSKISPFHAEGTQHMEAVNPAFTMPPLPLTSKNVLEDVALARLLANRLLVRTESGILKHSVVRVHNSDQRPFYQHPRSEVQSPTSLHRPTHTDAHADQDLPVDQPTEPPEMMFHPISEPP